MSIKCISFKFLLIKGRHTAKNIKKQYNELLSEYELEHKVFKVVADQAANMKKAFGLEQEGREGGIDTNAEPEDFFLMVANDLLINQRRLDIEENKKKQEAQACLEIEAEIYEMNKSSQKKITDYSSFSREQVKNRFNLSCSIH